MRPLLRVGLVLSLLVAAACRTPVEPTTVPDGTPPSSSATVEVCWAETAHRVGFTASALVVRHRDGDLLIDAGNSTALREEIKPYDGRTRRWLAFFPGSLIPKRPLSAVLEAMGVAAADLRWALPTHAHLDHIGGLLDLPPVPVLLDDEEARVVTRSLSEVRFEVMPAHAKAIAPRIERLTFAERPYEIFEHHADLYGDGSVVVVPLRGHTPGSVGVFVRRTNGRRIFAVGDAVNNLRQIERHRSKSLAMRRTDTDRGAAEHNIARLHALARHSSDIDILPAHERAAWVDLFGTPGGSCAP